jgi:hypothetical protein
MTQSLLDVIEMDLEDQTVYIDVYDNSLSRKWLAHLNAVIEQGLHLEKNYCFLGWAEGPRQGELIIAEINRSIEAINRSDLDYVIDHHFTLAASRTAAGGVNHAEFNLLHRWFEDLQGTAHAPSPLYARADATTRWHIRQLNLLCHEFESWQLSWRKLHTAPEWQRPSQLMCWLNAPRFELEPEDLALFGIETINRSLGGVYVGVNKAVGKHHWEVFCDEGRDSRVTELTTTTLATQTLACADFDIEWANDPGAYEWQQRRLQEFREWLTANGFDPADRSLTIGHPQVAQVNLQRSFGQEDYREIWARLNTRLNVTAIRTSLARAEYPYHWSDPDYALLQIKELQ